MGSVRKMWIYNDKHLWDIERLYNSTNGPVSEFGSPLKHILLESMFEKVMGDIG